jgi:hypothetical protein
MPGQNDVDSAIRKASLAYERARGALADELGPIEAESFEQILSLAEEFGAKHVCTLAQQSPVLLGLRPDAVSSETRLETLERKLQRFIDSNTALDRVIGQREAERCRTGQHPEKRIFAIHGELATVDLANGTLIFPNRAPEVLVLRDGIGPEPLRSESSRTRKSRRDRER